MSTAIQALNEAVNEVLGSYEPANLRSLQGIWPDLHGFFGDLSTQISSLADRTEEQSPLHSSLVETLREMSGTLAGLRDEAEEATGRFAAAHENDLQRLDEPRPGEHMADYVANE